MTGGSDSSCRLGQFPTAGDTIGNDTEEEVIFVGSTAITKAGRKGTLDDWKNHVAARTKGSSRLMFGICAGFAATLLKLSLIEGGGFHYRGESSSGKTTALKVAASVWDPDIQSWRATDNGLEGLANEHCDKLLCLDELSQVTAEAAGESAYMLANGQGKQRASKSGDPRPRSSWRCMFLSSGEVSLEAKLGEGKTRRRIAAGQELRVLDIPANAGVGLGIFEQVTDGTEVRQLVQDLSDSCSRYYGTAGPQFLRMVVRLQDTLPAEIQRTVEKIVRTLVPENANPQVQRAARRFALVGAAGRMASSWHIIPFTQAEVDEAVRRCFNAWYASRGHDGAIEEIRALRQVQAFFEQHSNSRFVQLGEPTERTPNAVGFWDKAKYYVYPNCWRDEVCKGLDPKLVNRVLAEKGILQQDSEGKFTRVVRTGSGSSRRLHVIDVDKLHAVEGPE
jgi:putative DNA primase/helicase